MCGDKFLDCDLSEASTEDLEAAKSLNASKFDEYENKRAEYDEIIDTYFRNIASNKTKIADIYGSIDLKQWNDPNADESSTTQKYKAHLDSNYARF